jgi:hypothetical protein
MTDTTKLRELLDATVAPRFIYPKVSLANKKEMYSPAWDADYVVPDYEDWGLTKEAADLINATFDALPDLLDAAEERDRLRAENAKMQAVVDAALKWRSARSLGEPAEAVATAILLEALTALQEREDGARRPR